MGRKPIDMIGKTFHQLTVLDRAGYDQYSKALYKCVCSCGNYSIVQGYYLRVGNTKSCGCRTTKTHGLSKHPLWKVWNSMHQRCTNPNAPTYKSYGDKGIKVCKEWKCASSFLEWALTNGWETGLTLDRIDEREDFSPSNCRFLTHSEIIVRKRITGKNVGKIFGTWKVIEKLPYDNYVTTQCIHCGIKDKLQSSNVYRCHCRQCKCRVT